MLSSCPRILTSNTHLPETGGRRPSPTWLRTLLCDADAFVVRLYGQPGLTEIDRSIAQLCAYAYDTESECGPMELDDLCALTGFASSTVVLSVGRLQRAGILRVFVGSGATSEGDAVVEVAQPEFIGAPPSGGHR